MKVIDISEKDQMEFKISCETFNDEIGIEIKTAYIEKSKKKIQDLYLTFEDVQTITSKGIGSLLFIIQHLKENNCKLYVVKISGPLKKIFDSLMLNNFLEYIEPY